MRKYGRLRETHPRVGKAMFGAFYEGDLTGDYPGQQVDEILRHDETTGTCRRCGSVEYCSHIRARMLVGANAGLVHDWYSLDCSTAACGAQASNYRAPWWS